MFMKEPATGISERLARTYVLDSLSSYACRKGQSVKFEHRMQISEDGFQLPPGAEMIRDSDRQLLVAPASKERGSDGATVLA